MKVKALFLGAVSIAAVFLSTQHAVAAACENTKEYGAVTVAVPKLPSKGEYTIWTRMQAPDTVHNRYSLEINGVTCFVVGGSSITPGEWVWVSHHDGILSSKVRYDFDKTTGNNLKLIGTDNGVKIDRLLIMKSACIPEGMGGNCQSESMQVSMTNVSGATEIMPPSNGPVSGLYLPSPTVSQNYPRIKSVIYYVDGKSVPTTTDFRIDTTLLTNGIHRISIKIMYKDGTAANEATNLAVENEQTAFSPVRRYVRLHSRAVMIIAGSIGVIVYIIIAVMITRHIRLQRRLLTFRGF